MHQSHVTACQTLSMNMISTYVIGTGCTTIHEGIINKSVAGHHDHIETRGKCILHLKKLYTQKISIAFPCINLVPCFTRINSSQLYIRCEHSFLVNFLSFYHVKIEFPTTLYRYDAGKHSATGNRVPKAISDKKRALGNVIMPQQCRENTAEEKRRM